MGFLPVCQAIIDDTLRTHCGGVINNRILLIFTVIPYPVRANGVSIRYFPLIQYLSDKYEIDIIVIGNENDIQEDIGELRRHCRNVFFVQDPKYRKHGVVETWSTKVKFFFPWTSPISLVVDGGREIVRDIHKLLRDSRYGTIVWVGPYLCPYLFPLMESISADRIVVDFIDSPTLWQKRRLERSMRLPLFQRYECWKTMRWEAGVIRRVSSAIYISEVDASIVPIYLTPRRRRRVIPNGISMESYSPGRRASLPAPNIGFLGNMAYSPNIPAVHWLHDEIFLPLRKMIPSLSLIVIGRDPVPSIRKLAENLDVIVTGTVENIWDYVNSVDVLVFPLWIGGGLKNKILEAMYAGRPVVTTRIGNEGIEATPGRDIMICSNAREFVDVVRNLLSSENDRTRIGESARRLVSEKFSWPKIIGQFEEAIMGSGR